MPPPLTKRKKTGELYVRTASVDAAIDRAAGLDLDAVIREARVDDRGAPGFMEPECLLHLVRSTRLDNSDDRFAQLFEILLDRVARSLKGSIRPSSLYDPEELRQEVADRFVDLLVEDRNQPGDGLDYFEVRFAPQLHAQPDNPDMSIDGVVRAVDRGLLLRLFLHLVDARFFCKQ